ncbi:MAG: DUF5915 domain-containing protein, partial [Gammaproteobacteria bacterium]|nr:DUF5915 domain-containing protein [Gammaproteobacteria bacterium]
YKLYNVVPQLFDFIEDLTNWYIRLNRSRFWGEEITADKIAAYSTLYTVLYELCQVMAPFAPFLAEHLYRELSALGGGQARPASVHLCDYPQPEPQLVREELEVAVDRMQQVVLLGRQKREEVKIGLRTPLRTLTIVNRDQTLLEELAHLEDYVKAELNVLNVSYDADEGSYIQVVAKPNFPVLGKRLGKRMKEFQQHIGALTSEQIAALQAHGEITIQGEVFGPDEIQVLQQARVGTNTISNSRIAVDLDCSLDERLVRGGYAREIINRIQRRRKELDLNVADRIEVRYEGDAQLLAAADQHTDYIQLETLATMFIAGTAQGRATAVEIDGMAFRFSIRKTQLSG